MSGWGYLRRVGGELLGGGLVVVVVSLAVLLMDEMTTGGREMVAATCVLFLWAGGIGAGVGLLLKILTRSRDRSVVSPWSPAWRPPPRGRSRR